jgi:hypothetical protein
MVATRLSEITTKGLDWYNSDGSSRAPPTRRTPIPESSLHNYTNQSWNYASSSINYASDSINDAAEQTYSKIAGVLSSFYTESAPPVSNTSTMERIPEERPLKKPSLKKPSLAISKYPELMSWMLKNPYTSVRGRNHHHPSSVSAVRSLLTLVPLDKKQGIYSQPVDPEKSVFPKEVTPQKKQPMLRDESHTDLEASWVEGARKKSKSVSSAETASQLTEGTVRALRDIALEEAVELHGALQFWTERWERPVLSWLEAGPWGKHSREEVRACLTHLN